MKQESPDRFEALAGSARQFLKSSRKYVRKHPWHAAGIVAAAAGATAALTWALRGGGSPQFALPLVEDEPAPRRKSTRRAAVASAPG